MNKLHPLAVWRQKSGLSQQQLAAAVGVTRWTINRVECGGRSPSRELIQSLVEKSSGQLRFEDFVKARAA
jgi:DNA-binding XRE family transcriptional regulator